MSIKERNRVEQIIIENNINVSNMYNKGRKIAFINENYLYSKDSEVITALQRFNQYGEREKEISKDLLEFLRSDFFYFFESFAWGYSTFNTNKSIMKAYLDWGRDQHLTDSKVSQELEKIGYDEPSHKKMFETYYFKSLDELNQEIGKIEKGIESESKILMFGITEVALYLAWSGVKIQDTCELERDDLNEQNKSLFIRSKNQHITLDSNIFDAISEYKYATDYMTSDKLMRTSASGKISVNNLSNLISKFFGDNALNDSDGKIINYNKVYWSGIYSRVVSEFGCQDLDNNDIEKLSDIFQEDYAKLANPQPAICKRLIEYQDYLTYMYGSEYLKY